MSIVPQTHGSPTRRPRRGSPAAPDHPATPDVTENGNDAASAPIAADAGARPARPPRSAVLSLAGPWQCALDRDDVGLHQGWHRRRLQVTRTDARPIDLPGTLNAAGIGDPLALEPRLDKTVLRGPHLRTSYTGAAWFQTEIDVPTDWAHHPLDLELERVLWRSSAWVIDRPLGDRDSLSTPHVYPIPSGLPAGRHRLTLRVDNRRHVDLGGSHAYTEETQGIWHGVVGRLQLRRRATVRIERVRVRSDVPARVLRIQVEVTNPCGGATAGTLVVAAALRGGDDNGGDGHAPARLEVPFAFDGDRESVRATLPLGDGARLWDEFAPNVYDVSVTLRCASPFAAVESTTVPVGLREVRTRPGTLLVNGRPTFLRGTLECCVFPRTGHPPCDADGWRRVMRVAGEYGLNHLRFHSWCPPEAAFLAADEAGMYLQVELPNWSFTDPGADGPVAAYLEAEGRRILNAYGNHPSFLLFSMGNELPARQRGNGNGDAAAEGFETWDALLRRLRAYDDRPLYSSTSFSFSDRGRWPGADDQFYVTQQTRNGWTRGQGFFNSAPPSTDCDFGPSVADCPVPIITHEVGQYSVYPDLRQIDKYTGPLRPLNLEAVRDDLAAKGMLDEAARLTEASGRWAVELYREDVERALRTPGLSGIQLLDLHDFPGQSTALVGLLDAFWDSKGLVDPATFRRSCAPVTVLLRLPKRVYEAGERLTARVQIANFGPGPIDAARIEWSVHATSGRLLGSGMLGPRRIELGNDNVVGEIDVPLDDVASAKELVVRAGIAGTGVTNEWRAWVYPPERGATDAPGDVLVRDELDDATLRALRDGARVVLLPHPSTLRHRVRGQFVPVFWSPLHFPNQPGTQGVLVDPSHSALAEFPTAMHADWQWWELTSVSSAMSLDALPRELRPIVQFVDNFARNGRPGAVWETAVGLGRLLVCTLDVRDDLAERPVARQLRSSLLRYAAGDAFAPTVRIAPELLAAQFRPRSRLAGARVVGASSWQPGCEPHHVLDDDPATLWHNDYSGGHCHPHVLVIDLGETRSLGGFTLLPRQDGNPGGLLDGYELHLSEDGDRWDLAVAGRLPLDASRKAVQFPARYDAGGTLLGRGRRGRFVRLVTRSAAAGSGDVAIAHLDLLDAEDAEVVR